MVPLSPAQQGYADRAVQPPKPATYGRAADMKGNSRFIISMLAFGYAFLYIPLLSVIVYSYNDSRLATVWGAFSTRWYGELLQNEQVLTSLFLSLKIGVTPDINALATLIILFVSVGVLIACGIGRRMQKTH